MNATELATILRLLAQSLDASTELVASPPSTNGMVPQMMPSEPQPVTKKKRKVSRYNRVWSKEFKRLKKEKPRTSPQKLMVLAHKAAKKALK